MFNFRNFILTVFVVTVFFLAANYAEAQDFVVPSDAVIKVYDKNGKEIGNMSRKQFKVVKIENHVKKEPQVVTIVKYKHLECDNPNRIQLKVGSGMDGLNTSSSNSQIEIAEKRKAIVGTSYSRKINETFNLGVSVHTNSTTTLDFGVDF